MKIEKQTTQAKNLFKEFLAENPILKNHLSRMVGAKMVVKIVAQPISISIEEIKNKQEFLGFVKNKVKFLEAAKKFGWNESMIRAFEKKRRYCLLSHD